MYMETLHKEFAILLKQIDDQLDTMTEEADEMGFSIYQLKNIQGGWVVLDLLCAKTQALVGLQTTISYPPVMTLNKTDG